MADRVHPLHPPSPPPLPAIAESETTPLHPAFHKPPPPPPGTYIIHVPKDQILRVPPPEHAKKFKNFQSRPKRRRAARRCCCYLIGATILLVLAAAVSAAVLYLVFQPRFPKYSIESVSIAGFNVTSTASAVASPVITAVVRADNSDNKMVGIEYLAGGNIAVSYDGEIGLGDAPWPAFYQEARNVTHFSTAVKGGGAVSLTAAEGKKMAEEQRKGAVPLTVEVDVAVKVRFGALTTWRIPIMARCDVTVSGLAASATVKSNSCSAKAKVLWWWW